MTFEEFNFVLEDRIAKAHAVNDVHDLLTFSSISISGGKDSRVASAFLDIAFPGNKIPRLFANTGIEYKAIVEYVEKWSKEDDRVVILKQKRNIKKTLNEYGYPFKSKEHSQRVQEFNRNSKTPFLQKYITGITAEGKETKFCCPKILRYQFETQGKYNFSKECCYKLKKDLLHEWQKENNKPIAITGMRASEGGNRKNAHCISMKGNKLQLFHPLLVVSEEWIDFFIEYYHIELCELYYPPYNFTRTGCKGCPYNLKLQEDLEILYKLLPKEYMQCLHLWKPVYDEYIRIGYRLKYYPHERDQENEDFEKYIGDYKED